MKASEIHGRIESHQWLACKHACFRNTEYSSDIDADRERVLIPV